MKKFLAGCLGLLWATAVLAGDVRPHKEAPEEALGACEIKLDGAGDIQNKFTRSVMALAAVDYESFGKLMSDFDRGINAFLKKGDTYDLKTRREIVVLAQLALGMSSVVGSMASLEDASKYRSLRFAPTVFGVAGSFLIAEEQVAASSGARPLIARSLSIPDLKQSEVESIAANTDLDKRSNEFCDNLASLFHISEAQRLPLRAAFKKELRKKIKQGGPLEFDLIAFLASNGYISAQMKSAAVELSSKLDRLSLARRNADFGNEYDREQKRKISKQLDSASIKATAIELIEMFNKVKATKELSKSQLIMVEDTILDLKSIAEFCS